MKRCSDQVHIKCSCPPDAPAVGTPLYGEQRTHPDAGDLEALRIVTGWVAARTPCLHLRFADGEFWSILDRSGVNTDGLAFDGKTLGRALDACLKEMASGGLVNRTAIIGGDWYFPEHAKYLRDNDLIRRIPWCPSSIFVNGVCSGELARFFEALIADPRSRILIANRRISGAATFLKSMFFEVDASASWRSRDSVSILLKHAPKDAVILYCAGMASEAFAWSAAKERPDLSHIDLGHIFDGAFGIRNRSWLNKEGVCERRDTYFARYVPVITGERATFGEF